MKLPFNIQIILIFLEKNWNLRGFYNKMNDNQSFMIYYPYHSNND